MDLQALTHEEMHAFLQRERILRLGLDADGERYLVPLGYVWLDGCICCVTLPGRKTQMLGRNPRVSFQMDDSATRGVFDWTSVSGEGLVEFVGDPARAQEILRVFLARFADMPQWAARQYEERVMAGTLVFLQITVLGMSGRIGAPPGS
ncbi:pyridoxamine 5'-phosphate oxidase family protein [Azohydromonas australica]|uniref:pyridoxamine 5'-phosphate oxidase family protein n=1 Tax=Azohydromonas australica TaxID=364039 RepID=UPI000413BD83|nr:pyridoxamine 5'-phosphate oxidase family protein [Azohydromonas australica]